jgi:molecular chaperone DnaJ
VSLAGITLKPMPARPDPFATLGVGRNASDAEIRSAYRRLVQLHHPDHNGGSAESARRFEEVQEAYATVRKLRQPGSGRAGAGGGGGPGRPAP